MITDFIYSTPTWVGGTALVLLEAAACIGLVVFHRVIHVDRRRAIPPQCTSDTRFGISRQPSTRL